MGLKINGSLSQSATIVFKFLRGEFSTCSGLLWLMMNLNSVATDSILILLLPGRRNELHDDTTLIIKYGGKRRPFSKDTRRPIPPGWL